MKMIGNLNALNRPFDSQGEREWSFKLCDCCGDGWTVCMKSTFCPCVIYSQNKTRLDHLEREGRPHPDGGDSCGTDCLIYYCLGSINWSWLLQMAERTRLRRRYSIEGSGFGDCCESFWCGCCANIQAARELALEESTYRF